MKRKATLLVPREAPHQGKWTKAQREEFHELKEDILSAVMQVADEKDWSNADLARESNLSTTCVNNIFRSRTSNPSMGSCMKLTLACGLRLAVIEARLKIKRRNNASRSKLKLRKAS